MAEGEGFEPPAPLQAQQFSRLPVSTAHPSLRIGWALGPVYSCGGARVIMDLANQARGRILAGTGGCGNVFRGLLPRRGNA